MTISVHTSTEPTAADRGYTFGLAHQDAVRTTIASDRRLFAAVTGPTVAEVQGLGARQGPRVRGDDH